MDLFVKTEHGDPALDQKSFYHVFKLVMVSSMHSCILFHFFALLSLRIGTQIQDAFAIYAGLILTWLYYSKSYICLKL